MYVCIICTAEKEFRLCKNIAKFAFFSLQNFAFWPRNLRILFCKKKQKRGDRHLPSTMTRETEAWDRCGWTAAVYEGTKRSEASGTSCSRAAQAGNDRLRQVLCSCHHPLPTLPENLSCEDRLDKSPLHPPYSYKSKPSPTKMRRWSSSPPTDERQFTELKDM